MTRIHFRSSPLRSTADRIRQAVSFEIIGLAIVTPLFAWIFDQRMRDMGILALLGAAVATAWNYLFNLGFDHVLRWRRGDASKTLPIRLVHALLFEATRLLFLLLFAWWLAIPVLSALPVALSFAAFHVACAFLFTCGQDILFPREGADWEAACPATKMKAVAQSRASRISLSTGIPLTRRRRATSRGFAVPSGCG